MDPPKRFFPLFIACLHIPPGSDRIPLATWTKEIDSWIGRSELERVEPTHRSGRSKQHIQETFRLSFEIGVVFSGEDATFRSYKFTRRMFAGINRNRLSTRDSEHYAIASLRGNASMIGDTARATRSKYLGF
jgi:hypothetical protein